MSGCITSGDTRGLSWDLLEAEFGRPGPRAASRNAAATASHAARATSVDCLSTSNPYTNKITHPCDLTDQGSLKQHTYIVPVVRGP